jgi:hypothetical protein
MRAVLVHDATRPYELKLKEYEQRLAEIERELLGKTEGIGELVGAETEELPRLQKCSRPIMNPQTQRSRSKHLSSKIDLPPRLA